MTDDSFHLVVGTPCFGGQVYGAYFTSMFKLQEACVKNRVPFTLLMSPDETLITRARQDLVARFLEIPGATHLLFVDADIGFEPEQAFRLLRFNEDVTAAVYPLKKLDWEKIRKMVLAGEDHPESAALSYICELIRPGQVRDWFAKASYVGNGFLMIRRSALAAMMARYPQLRYQTTNRPGDPLSHSPFRYAFFNCLLDEKAHTYLPEDYSFCKRWTDIGGEIWVDMGSRLDHVGSTLFKGNTMRQKGPGPVPGVLPKGLTAPS
jgi:hypothetical protein